MKRFLFVIAIACLPPLLDVAQAQPLRDPFARPAPAARVVQAPDAAEPAQEPAPPPAPQLRAVMVTPGRALANINGQILASGEWFGDYQLIKVEERGVTLKKRGVTSVLLLDESRK
ncbi:hypothetical protein LK540_06725 [Massilia sp. IC2-278]|uniref:hypothetical protein n=1 Tax=Massilia sp. IC2-278 TaxID=2887200 RepID=UPI001E460D14|nr:hypothetical protein [Massilia sp. IC2-278]MCC2960122.1 hypothetical protein [Massilia sp. IC2-278]